jgi:hypothetical protein
LGGLYWGLRGGGGEAMSADFRKSEEWKLAGNNFLVVVKHHTASALPAFQCEGDGLNRWSVYAYIYPKHPHFENFSGKGMRQDAATAMPLHCGPSLLRWHYDDDHKPTSVQVGSDYNHLHDSEFTFYATEDDATEVFSDARRLHAWLESQATTTDGVKQ